VFQIIAGTQSYDWGKLGLASKVAQFARLSIPDFKLEQDKPYAELWMGTHPSLPSKLTTGELLSAHLKAHPGLLGERVVKHFGADLPFLFKVLAIGKALSIQAHPDKELAKKLHEERPDIYKDANHKPEMALAITPFRGFCGFLPLPVISFYLSRVPEFSALVSHETIANFHTVVSDSLSVSSELKSALEDVFAAVMTASEDLVREKISALVKRYESGEGLDEEEEKLKELVLELNRQFPGDIGIFCVFLLNVVDLKPGQAIFLKADEPHAYISGDIMECMATSDNVVRAGLTPKLRDVPTLVSMLTYNHGPADSQIMPPAPFRSTKHTTLYDPPIEEFSVLLTTLANGEDEVHEAINGPSIFLVTQGKGKITWSGQEEVLSEGLVFFVGAGTEVKFKSGNDAGLVLYRAFVEAP